MESRNEGEPRALFQSISSDGIDWLFVIRSNGDWAITRNGIEAVVGTGERSSIAAGVKEFVSLTHAGSHAACNAAVAVQLDRIERGRDAALRNRSPRDGSGRASR